MLLYKIGENEIDKAATPVGLKQLVEIFKSADVYVAYLWNRSNRSPRGIIFPWGIGPFR